jgi:hypothetical protein
MNQSVVQTDEDGPIWRNSPQLGAALRLGANNTRLSAARLLLRPAIGLYR